MKGREGKGRGVWGEMERDPLLALATQAICFPVCCKDATYLLRFHSNVTSMLGVVQAHTRKTRYSYEHVYSSTSDSNQSSNGSTLYHWQSHQPLKGAGYLTIPAHANCSDFSQHNLWLFEILLTHWIGTIQMEGYYRIGNSHGIRCSSLVLLPSHPSSCNCSILGVIWMNKNKRKELTKGKKLKLLSHCFAHFYLFELCSNINKHHFPLYTGSEGS